MLVAGSAPNEDLTNEVCGGGRVMKPTCRCVLPRAPLPPVPTHLFPLWVLEKTCYLVEEDCCHCSAACETSQPVKHASHQLAACLCCAAQVLEKTHSLMEEDC